MSRLPFPRTLSAFQSRFATEEACVHYLFESRWADGYACPRCGHDEAYELELRPKYANAGNAVTRSRLLRARCSIARDCPFGIGFRPPTWSPPTRQASLRCNCNGNSVSGATKQRGDSCRSCDEPWFDLSGTASPARWRSMRPMWVGSKSGAEVGGCATVPRRSWSVPSRSAARDPV